MDLTKNHWKSDSSEVSKLSNSWRMKVEQAPEKHADPLGTWRDSTPPQLTTTASDLVVASIEEIRGSWLEGARTYASHTFQVLVRTSQKKIQLLLLLIPVLAILFSPAFHTPLFRVAQTSLCSVPLSHSLPFCPGPRMFAALAQNQAMEISKWYNSAIDVCGRADSFVQMRQTSAQLASHIKNSSLFFPDAFLRELHKLGGVPLQDAASSFDELCDVVARTADRGRHSFYDILRIVREANDALTVHGLSGPDVRSYEERFRRAFSDAEDGFLESEDSQILSSATYSALEMLEVVRKHVNVTEDALRDDRSNLLGPFAVQVVPPASWWCFRSILCGPPKANVSWFSEHVGLLDDIRRGCNDAEGVAARNRDLVDMLSTQQDSHLFRFPVAALFKNPVALKQLIVTLDWYKTNVDRDAQQFKAAKRN